MGISYPLIVESVCARDVYCRYLQCVPADNVLRVREAILELSIHVHLQRRDLADDLVKLHLDWIWQEQLEKSSDGSKSAKSSSD
jgi:hypothetical protein